MRKRQLGTGDLMITPLGIGAWAMGGGGWTYAWGPQDDRQSVAAIHAGLDAGMNWIDTAAVYGLGHSEEIVARALEGLTDRPYVFTKCGLVWDEKGEIGGRLTSDSIRRECEASLRRLKVDAIDLYQIHWPNPDADIEEGWTTLARLREEGKVRHVGVSNFSVRQMERAAKIAPITSLQPPYSLLDRGVEAEILDYVKRENVGVIAYSPMGAGMFTGAMTRERIANFPADDWRRRNPNFQEPKLSHNLKIAERLRDIGARHGRTAGEVALAWVLRREEVTGAIAGVRSADQVTGIIGAGAFRLTSEEITEIEAVA